MGCQGTQALDVLNRISAVADEAGGLQRLSQGLLMEAAMEFPGLVVFGFFSRVETPLYVLRTYENLIPGVTCRVSWSGNENTTIYKRRLL